MASRSRHAGTPAKGGSLSRPCYSICGGGG
jgi:hypothetical protein